MNIRNSIAFPRILALNEMARRRPSYIGKRANLLANPSLSREVVNSELYDDEPNSDLDDNSSVLVLDKRRVPGFVGKRGRMFVGKRESDGFEDEESARMLLNSLDEDKRGRMFVGKRDMLEDKRGRMFVGKRDSDEVDKRARMFVGKKAAYGPREARLWVGKRDYDYRLQNAFGDDDKRARFFVGKKARQFVGKRDALDDLDEEKRGRMFVGKKSSAEEDWEAYQQLLNEQAHEKRGRMFVGKRRLFVGKREQDADEEAEKRARFFVGRRSDEEWDSDKRGRMFVGKRDSIDKRARIFVGKRSLDDQETAIEEKSSPDDSSSS